MVKDIRWLSLLRAVGCTVIVLSHWMGESRTSDGRRPYRAVGHPVAVFAYRGGSMYCMYIYTELSDGRDEGHPVAVTEGGGEEAEEDGGGR